VARGRIAEHGTGLGTGSAVVAADPAIHPVDVVQNALISAERNLNPALAKFLEIRDKVETMPVEEIALLRGEIAEAIEQGQAEAERVKGALERLVQALPEPGSKVPLGF
jgi:hypothetical protein